MRALENRAIFSDFRQDRDKKIEEHHDRIKNVRTVVDTSVPYSLATRCTSPSKRLITKQSIRDRIVKENLKLAQKIFHIMEGNSDITEQVNDTRHIDGHPGTMNFRQRLTEAQRIHERNMLLASRLDTVQPYYKVKDLRIARPIKKKVVVHKKNPKKSLFAKELNTVLRGERGIQNIGQLTHRSTGHDAPVGVLKFSKLAPGDNTQSQSARKADYVQKGGSVDSESRTETQRTRPSNVLLEYTKIQDGRVLDVAVLKEPFRDRYAIFGIDVDDGQRYELRLTSDEVSSILDGDMLVTSVDNVEVWMALLNKVALQRVGFFARLPFTNDEVDTYNNSASSPTRAKAPPAALKTESGAVSDQEEFGEAVPYHYTLTNNDSSISPPLSPTTKRAASAGEESAKVPTAPAGQRPSNDRPISRVAGSAGGVTSAAGAVRMRHIRSAGAAGKDAPTSASATTGGEAPASRAARKSAQSETEQDANVDPILSLFADAGVNVDFARTEVVTPGFLANATSAPVTLVETNDDFPDAPVTTETGVVQEQVQEAAKPQPAPVKTNSGKPTAPSKPTTQKNQAPTRAASMRAAEVRRKSIESEKANNSRAVTMVGAPTAGMDAALKSKAAKEEATKKPAVVVVETAKAPVAMKVEERPVDEAAVAHAAPPKSASRGGAPTGPKPPTSRAPSTGDTNDAATATARPKSRLYTPKAPAAVPAAVPASAAAPAPVTSDLPARPKTGGRTPTAPKTPTSTAPAGSPRTGSGTGASPRVRPPSQSPEKARPAPQVQPKVSAEEKVEAVVQSTEAAAVAVTEDAGAAQLATASDRAAEEAPIITSAEAEVTTEEAAATAEVTATAGESGEAAEVDEEKEVEGEGEDVSTALLEGSKMGRSVNASEAETPLEYSTDFENSVSGAEVYKFHE